MPTKGKVQSILFSKDKWTEERSKKWLEDHQYTSSKIDRKGKCLRYRQLEPEEFHYLRTRKILPGVTSTAEEGISFVMGYSESKKGRSKSEIMETSGGELSMRNMAASFLPKFDWEKYPGEKHLPGFQYVGPQTRLDLRLDENDKPKPGEEPINGLDRIAYFHDLRYKYAGDNLDLQHNADLIMIEDLRKLKPQSLLERFYRWLCENIISAKVKLGMGLNNLGEWEPKNRKKYEGLGFDINELARDYGSL